MSRRERQRRKTTPRANWKRILNRRRPYEGQRMGPNRHGTYDIAALLRVQTTSDFGEESIADAMDRDVIAYRRLTGT